MCPPTQEHVIGMTCLASQVGVAFKVDGQLPTQRFGESFTTPPLDGLGAGHSFVDSFVLEKNVLLLKNTMSWSNTPCTYLLIYLDGSVVSIVVVVFVIMIAHVYCLMFSLFAVTLYSGNYYS